MIDQTILLQTLADQREELEAKENKKLCRRMEQDLIELNSPLAQVVIGVRRCGKSTMCYQALREAKINFAYVNFDDENLSLVNAGDLNTLLESLYTLYGKFTHLFLDEIQNVEGWQLFVNRLLRREMKIIITGSNAKLLSSDLATHLTGRHHVINLFPLSFREYCECNDVDLYSPTTEKKALRRRAFNEYLHQGGFPQLLQIENKRAYINDLTEAILRRDIEQRFKIRHPMQFERLANHMMNIAPVIISAEKQAKELDFKSTNTFHNYLGYLCEAFLLVNLHKYSQKSKIRLVGEKYYCIDPALMDKRIDAFSGENFGWRMETIAFLELKRHALIKGNDIYYLSESGRGECDFIITLGNQAIEAIQVSYDISNPKTYRREINGLITAAKKTNCKKLLLLTENQRETVEADGYTVEVKPIYEWLIEINSKENYG
ncbi:MAG: ATP-binding protein [Muribaculaceae bacterium]|nr:ATP-binding protein [Muribaculaceae bacterium]